jgi:dihydropteroate synthase
MTTKSINCKGQLIEFNQPKVMGIINLTPDSFYEKSRHRKIKDILKQVDKMLTDGADFIDIGGYSSRPGADGVAEEEEITRVVPIVEKLTRHFPSALVSVDTFRSEVAWQSLDSGAAIINDISAGHLDNQMMTVVKKYQVPYIMMHMKGTPQTMKTLNQYDDLITDIKYYFSERIAKANQLGINDLIIDPGLGFAKNIDQNFKLLKHLSDFEDFNYPMLIGLSRKSMIYKTLGFTADQALNGTSALNMLALDRGASILRVHDVKEAIECCRLFNKMN